MSKNRVDTPGVDCIVTPGFSLVKSVDKTSHTCLFARIVVKIIMANKKSPVVTLNMFNQEILPRFEEIVAEKMAETFDKKFLPYRNEVVDFKVEILGEIKNLREEIAVAGHQYDRTNRRVDKIDEHLGINTVDLA